MAREGRLDADLQRRAAVIRLQQRGDARAARSAGVQDRVLRGAGDGEGAEHCHDGCEGRWHRPAGRGQRDLAVCVRERLALRLHRSAELVRRDDVRNELRRCAESQLRLEGGGRSCARHAVGERERYAERAAVGVDEANLEGARRRRVRALDLGLDGRHQAHWGRGGRGFASRVERRRARAQRHVDVVERLARRPRLHAHRDRRHGDNWRRRALGGRGRIHRPRRQRHHGHCEGEAHDLVDGERIRVRRRSGHGVARRRRRRRGGRLGLRLGRLALACLVAGALLLRLRLGRLLVPVVSRGLLAGLLRRAIVVRFLACLRLLAVVVRLLRLGRLLLVVTPLLLLRLGFLGLLAVVAGDGGVQVARAALALDSASGPRAGVVDAAMLRLGKELVLTQGCS